MTEFGISPDDLRRLARLLEENGLSELRYEEGDMRITLRTADAPTRRGRGSTSGFVGGVAAVSAMGETAHIASDAFAAANPALVPGVASADTGMGSGEGATAAAGALDFAGAVRIDAPVMGVFYRAAAPGEPPLVEIGDTVSPGQPVGLIEAMKVFSEVPAESGGVVRAIPVKNGALVHPGDPLVVLEPTGS